MPEGDTVWRAARAQHAALAGQLLTASDLRVPKFATAELAGERVHEVVSRGKHLLHRIGEHTLHTHLRMEGVWQLYRPGERWRRPAHQARAVLETAGRQSVGFELGITELVLTSEEHTVVGHLGPDLLGADWDADIAAANLVADPDLPVFVALHDQRNLAGLGNEYVNELCFLRGLDPRRPVGQVDDVAALVALSHRVIRANREREIRTTTGVARYGQHQWVYGRAGRPCRRCGSGIRRDRLGPDAVVQRDAYSCPSCQR